MTWSQLVYLSPYLLSLALSTAFTGVSLSRRRVTGAQQFALIAFSMSACTLGFLLKIVSPALSAKLFWDNFQWLFTFLLVLGLAEFSRVYNGRPVVRSQVILQAALSLLLLTLIYTDGFRGDPRPGARLLPGGAFAGLYYDYTLWDYLAVAWFFLVGVAAGLPLLGFLRRQPRLFRRQAGVILLGMLLPLLGAIPAILNIYLGPQRDLTPYTFAGCLLLIAWGLFRYHLMDLVPVAYQAVLDRLEAQMLVVDLQERILYLNPSAARFLGRPVEQLIGQPFNQVWGGSIDLARWPAESFHQQEILLARPGGAPTGPLAESITRPSAGTKAGSQAGLLAPTLTQPRAFELELTPLNRRDGQLAGRLVLLRDITRRRQAEQALNHANEELEARVRERTARLEQLNAALQESEGRYRGLFEASPEAILLLDLQGAVRFANLQAAVLFGLDDPQQLLGAPAGELLRPAKSGLALSLYDLLDESGRLDGLEVSLQRRDGATCPGLASLALLRDAARQPASLLAFVQDIRARKQAEAALLRSGEQARRLITAGVRLNRSLDLQAVYAAICDEARRVLDAPAAAVMVLDPPERQLRPTFLSGLPFAALQDFVPLPLDAFLAACPDPHGLVELPDERLEPGDEIDILADKWDLRRGLAVPLYFEERLVGLLAVFFSGQAEASPGEQLDFLQAYAQQAAAALANARLFEQVYVGRQRLQELSMKLLRVQENERRYLAQELHDQVGQLLTGLQFTLESGKRLPAERMRERMAEAQELIAALIAQVRDLSLSLRPSQLDELGLLPALFWHFRHFEEQTGIQVDFTYSGLRPRYSPEVETAVYRIVQEALTNVARHARVEDVCADLEAEDGRLRLVITDHGVGFDVPAALQRESSLGLVGMRERALLLGGELTLQSAPGQGVQLEAILPVSGVPLERRKDDNYRPHRG